MTRNIACIALLSALLVVAQIALSVLPNIEVVTLLLFIYTKVFKIKITLVITVVFIVLQALVWGAGTWVIGYMIVWPMYVLLMQVMMKYLKNEVQIAIFLGILGLLFGMFMSIEYLLYSRVAVLYYIMRGIPFDIVHSIGNFSLALCLYSPIIKMIEQIKKRYYF